ncbi:MAG: ribosomal-protein-alanine N-acetyltransferase [Gammaproteobacteria bacterium RIFCSPHIGHO2_12_FULL_37_34]|nr:MAG: ribosomal-protein-alanine N-acetyltransferase [Gammaproteobacteria bacterium RIFCSPHIGHO2_12_FULL_37_34]
MIREFVKSDLIPMMAIEHVAHAVPWTEETFKMCLQSHYIGWVLELDKKIIGFVIVTMEDIECHILNLCVIPHHQHQGWGRKLLEHVVMEAKQCGVGIVYLEVRRTNSRAISLYQKLDFHLVGERKGYYPVVSGQEDALIYAKSLSES